MNTRFHQYLQISLALLDFLTINVIFLITEFLFRKQLLITPNREYLYFALFMNAVWLGVAMAKKIYHDRNIVSFEQFSKVSMQAYAYFLAIVIIFLFYFPDDDVVHKSFKQA